MNKLNEQQYKEQQQLNEQQQLLSEHQLLNEHQLYIMGSILEKCVEGAEILASSANTFQYAFRYKKIVDYSEKKFLCTQAQATRKLFLVEMKSDSNRNKLMNFISSMKKMLDELENKEVDKEAAKETIKVDYNND